MHPSHLENTLFDLLCQHTLLRPRDARRLTQVCHGALLARSTFLSLIARGMPQPVPQPSRLRNLQRFLDSPRFGWDVVYAPLVRHALHRFQPSFWHLIIDRSKLVPHVFDMVMVSLYFRRRALPLVWQVRPCGSVDSASSIALLSLVRPLIPAQQRVLLHGDSEFGAVPIMQFARDQEWDFILGQSAKICYHHGDWQWQTVANLPIPRRGTIYLANIFWTKLHCFGPLNFFAFRQPRQNRPRGRRYEMRYCTTSVPVSDVPRRLGRRRWGIEPMFRDYKSAGWQFDQSGLLTATRRMALLQVLSINYLWASSLGRWLTKRGQRHLVDTKKNAISATFDWAWTG
jgi:hypothetical protein